jgi:hypothetical protein
LTSFPNQLSQKTQGILQAFCEEDGAAAFKVMEQQQLVLMAHCYSAAWWRRKSLLVFDFFQPDSSLNSIASFCKVESERAVVQGR